MKAVIISFTMILNLVLSLSANSNQYDPMAPPGYGPVVKDNIVDRKKVKRYYYNLRQVVISEKGNRAVINGSVLKEGEYINKAKVVKIEANKVTLSKSGKLSVIKLNHPMNKVRR
jgi:hypothetical protein